ncbi:MAG: DUF4129 domain-containing protein [Deltaproteobacteria bacterium]|nr:MAG: DUF4129 domain-containing protein [Deltaproteobacteria bacterium]
MRALFLVMALVACGETTLDTALPDVGDATATTATAASASADEEALLSEAFHFCHEPHVDIEDVREWCPYVDRLDPERCPGVVETCADADAEERALPPVNSGCNQGQSGGPTDQFSAPEPPPPPPPDRAPWELPECSCQAPESALGLFTAVLQLSAGLLIALLIGAFVRLILMAFVQRQPDSPVATVAIEPEAPPPVDEIPELPSEDLLAAARRALDEGRLEDAVLFARSAALRALGDAGRVRLHRSRTDREYARMVRSDTEVYTPLREIFRAVERVRWGRERPTADRVRAVFAAAERILGVALALLLVLTLTGANNDDRYGAEGDAALFDLYQRYGYDAHWRMRALSKLDGEVDVLVLDLSRVSLVDGDREVLRRWVGDGGVLLVAGDAEMVFDELGEVTLIDDASSLAPSVASWLDTPPTLPQPALTYAMGTGRTWVQHGTGDLVEAMTWGNGGIVAFPDARLFTNAALMYPENERLLGMAPLLGSWTSLWSLERVPRLEIATLNAAAAESPMDSLRNAQLLPIVLQLLLLAIVAAVWKGTPFRPLRDPPEEGRRSFAEHVRALGDHYARRGGSRRAASAYAQLLLATRGRHALLEAARRHGATGEEAAAFVQRVEACANEPDAPADPAEDLALMEELWKIDPTR